MAKISLVESTGSYQGVTHSLRLIEKDLKQAISGKKEILIKINFVTTHKELATTPFQAVKAFVDFIAPFYHGQIVITEEATFGNTDHSFAHYGFTALAQTYPNLRLFNTARDQSVEAKLEYLDKKTHVNLAQIYTGKPFIVSVCRPKTHDSVVMTASLKNLLVGAIKHGTFKKRFLVDHSPRMNYFLAALAREIFPSLAIIDGTGGMEGNGPAYGSPINSGWALTSLDALAADSLAAYLMGIDVQNVGYLNLIRQEKLGKLYPTDEIEIVGAKPEKLVKHFKLHSKFPKMLPWKYN
jgi:uncharacterized protein (DUF362 family)